MKTVSIGPKSYLDLIHTKLGPYRKIRIVEVTGITGLDTGAGNGGVQHGFIDQDYQPVAVIDMSDGKLRTAEFSDTGATNGFITQLDTGPAGNPQLIVFSDTGR